MLRLSTARPRLNRGITFVDVTLTVMILGVLSSVAVPKFLSSLDYHRAKSSAAQIEADLNLARRLAMAKSESVTVQFAAASEEYTLEGIAHPHRVGQTYTVRLGESPWETNLVSAFLGGDDRVVFNAYGLPDSGGTITVEAGEWQQTVTIDPNTGRAELP